MDNNVYVHSAVIQVLSGKNFSPKRQKKNKLCATTSILTFFILRIVFFHMLVLWLCKSVFIVFIKMMMYVLMSSLLAKFTQVLVTLFHMGILKKHCNSWKCTSSKAHVLFFFPLLVTDKPCSLLKSGVIFYFPAIWINSRRGRNSALLMSVNTRWGSSNSSCVISVRATLFWKQNLKRVHIFFYDVKASEHANVSFHTFHILIMIRTFACG